MMTPEKKVKMKVVEVLKEFGAYYFYASTGGYGASGVPDIIGCYHGYFFGIECKAGKGKPTALQEKNISNIYAAGGTAIVVNENNIDDVRNMLISMNNVEFERAWLETTVQDTTKELIEARRLTNEVIVRSSK